MKKADKKTAVLTNLRRMFLIAGRIGSERDEPEGSRYVQLSDTFIKEILDDINEALK